MKDTSIIGETRLMKCGMKCTVIEDFGSTNITVQFEDGAIVYKRQRTSFRRGSIANPNYSSHLSQRVSHLNETRMMRCGLNATIIAENTQKDITVQFEDGVVVEHKTYQSFRDGYIKHPTKNQQEYEHELTGETRKMNCGLFATVIEDYGKNDITVQFENGEIRQHIWRVNFLRGSVACPGLSKSEANRISIVGETRTMDCGLKCTVIQDNGTNDISVEFDDGTVKEHQRRRDFKYGMIVPPNYKRIKKAPEEYIGVSRLMGCGLSCQVIKCNEGLLTVQFEDGIVVDNQTIKSFDNHSIKHPTKKFSKKRNYIGETRMMNCGLTATVIEDFGSKNLTIQFEDGTIRENVGFTAFSRGEVSRLNNKARNKMVSIGERALMACGMYCTIIRDYGENDIAVEFEDGTIIEHCRRGRFIERGISNPNIDRTKSILGQTERMRNGQLCTVIEDNGSEDITVRFEDGTIIEHTYRTSFRTGYINNPNFTVGSILGVEKTMKNGVKATVIEDINAKNITIKFEDGTIVTEKQREKFLSGNIGNPNLNGRSYPERILYYVIKRYFPEAIREFRPDWLKNPLTNANLEIDIWIPDRNIGIEYDGAAYHNTETQRSLAKKELIEAADEITSLIVVLEKGSIEYNTPKRKNYMLHHDSSYYEYPHLLRDLEEVINSILHYLGINESISIDDVLDDLD